MNKILLALIVGLFAANTYAADLPAAEPAADTAKAADTTKHTAAPAKKANSMKKKHKKEAEEKSTTAKPEAETTK